MTYYIIAINIIIKKKIIGTEVLEIFLNCQHIHSMFIKIDFGNNGGFSIYNFKTTDILHEFEGAIIPYILCIEFKPMPDKYYQNSYTHEFITIQREVRNVVIRIFSKY